MTNPDLAALSEAATQDAHAAMMDRLWQALETLSPALYGEVADAFGVYRRLVLIDREEMRERIDNLGPFTFSVVHSENYSGEHREWEEPGYTLPRGAKLIRTIADAAIAAILGEGV